MSRSFVPPMMTTARGCRASTSRWKRASIWPRVWPLTATLAASSHGDRGSSTAYRTQEPGPGRVPGLVESAQVIESPMKTVRSRESGRSEPP